MWKCLCNWVMSRCWKSFEVHARKSLDFLKGTMGRNIDIKVDSGESSERKEERLYYLREYICIYHHEQNVDNNINVVNVKGATY